MVEWINYVILKGCNTKQHHYIKSKKQKEWKKEGRLNKICTNPIFMKYKYRQNWYMLLEVKVMFALGGMEHKREGTGMLYSSCF